MKSLKSMMRKRRVGDDRPEVRTGTAINVPIETRDRLKLYCAVHNLSMCRVVAALIEDYMACGDRFEKSVERCRAEFASKRQGNEIQEVSP